jgi:hypothetical protein
MAGKTKKSKPEKGLCCVNGRYRRTIGKWVNANGKVAPKRFLLGKSEAEAKIANAKLEALWEIVKFQWEAQKWARQQAMAFVHQPGEPPPELIEPLWQQEHLAIAEAIRNGEHRIVVDPVKDEGGAYAARLHYLNKTYGTLVAFIPRAPDQLLQAKAQHEAWANHNAAKAARNAAIAGSAIPKGTGQTLYQAIDVYAEHVQQKNRKEYGRREAACAHRLKDSHRDVALEAFGFSVLEAMGGYWARRPEAKTSNGKGKRKPLALNTITNHLKTTRRFVRWLDRSDRWQWESPRHWEEALKVNVEQLRTDAEIAQLGRGVETYSIDELAILWKYATDIERVFLLLGLNCGFSQAECITLRHDEIDRACDPVTIKRVRRKTRVYGEFALWPETIAAIDGFVGQRPARKAADPALALATERGAPFTRQRIANMWTKLLRRITQDHPTFRGLSFKFLRKTAGQLIRNRSNGEIAGVFLCHGQAVKTDELAAVYTNRPFNKVADALSEVREDLQPMVGAASNKFKSP